MKTPRFITSLAAMLLASVSWGSPIVWNGPIISFAKPNGADWTLPVNQDQITPLVWLTRASSQGLFNIEVEPAFTHSLSPSGTEWAFGTTANYSSLTYTNWEAWTGGAGGGPPSTVGQDAVIHLITEDIYADIKFTSWSGSGGAGFSYLRSTAPVPEPGSLAVLGAGAVALVARRRSAAAQAGGRIV